MSNKYNHHISAIANMHRHFTESGYNRFYRAIRKAHNVGGEISAIRVSNDTWEDKHELTSKAHHLAQLAWQTYCNVHRDNYSTALEIYNFIKGIDGGIYTRGTVDMWYDANLESYCVVDIHEPEYVKQCEHFVEAYQYMLWLDK